MYPDIPAVILSGWMSEVRNFFGPSDKTKRGGHPHTQLSSWNDYTAFLIKYPLELSQIDKKIRNVEEFSESEHGYIHFIKYAKERNCF